MARLHSGENFDLPIVVELQRLGHDVLSALAAGRAGRKIPDPDVLAFATSQGRAVLTFDRRDFIRLHHHNPGHAGIIVCTKDSDRPALAARIHQKLLGYADLTGELIRVYRPARPGPASPLTTPPPTP
jgi:hypothetical protein